MPKKPSKLTLSKGLQAVDLFEDPIRFNIDGAETLKTSLGGLLSIIIIIFLVIQIIIQSVSIFNRENPAIVQVQEIENDPLQISLSKANNFIFAIGIQRDNEHVNLTQGTAVSFIADYSHQIRATDGSLTKHKADIIWAPCIESNFSTDVFPDTTFTSYSLRYAYCPIMLDYTDATTRTCPDDVRSEYPTCKAPFEFSLQGNFLSFNFKYLQVSMHPCIADDSTHIKDLVCSADTTTAFDSSEFKVNLYYANTLINPVDHEVPNKTYIETMYWSVTPSVYKLAEIYVDSVTVQDYDDFFSTSSYSNRSYFNLDINSMRETQVFHRTDMLELNFRRSNLNSITIRKFPKILDVVSSIGGISKVLLVIGAIIAIGYSKYRHHTLLSNKLYDFPLEDKRKVYLKKGSTLKELQAKKVDLNHMATLSVNKAAVLRNVDSHHEENKVLEGTQRRQLRSDVMSYITHMFYWVICRKDPDAQLAQNARAQVIKDLDMIKIVEKLKEIDKLKMILLNRQQREAFDFFEKPLITSKNEKPKHRDSGQLLDSLESSPIKGKDSILLSVKNGYENMTKYARLYMAYTLLKADNDPRNWRFNKKIINMLREDLVKVFQKVDEHFGEMPDPGKFDEVVKKVVMRDDCVTLTNSPGTEIRNLNTQV